MSKQELMDKIREILPEADFAVDLNDQVVIYTGLQEHGDSDELTELEL